jgi:hypothetical protein
MDDQDVDMDKFLINPRLTKVCQRVYAVVFQPINRLIDWLSENATRRFVEENLKEDSES